MDEQRDKKDKLMRFWMFGSFTIIVAAMMVYTGMFVGLAVFSMWQFWVGIVVAAALFIGSYFFYDRVLNK